MVVKVTLLKTAVAGAIGLGLGVVAVPGQAALPDGARGGIGLEASAEVPPDLGFGWPVPAPVTIERAFDRPDQPWLAGHRGVDLTAGAGQAVLAPAAGYVRFSGWIVDRHVVVIDHGDLASTLEPVVDAPPVGTAVEAGSVVGQVAGGEAAHCLEACLHWGVRRGQDYLDPALLVNPPPFAVLWE
ncbi:MAG: peptidoglycan DD-metalloendopeptidase family protein [Bifidobacteriaceae bacterium]|jgi:murein DD-endopeptidase MepM/ murein hydrolase activator NlpD|nr:peptidoglycan DD-metalloendopeptidase family protein [Bifidobacteriaceae bacterium]